MVDTGLVHAAALNNAEWCHAFCGTHGIAGRLRDDYWCSPVRTPPSYPDAVTLLPEVAVEELLSGIDTGEGSSVKDSFARLDLVGAGYRSLFRAEWLVWDRPEPGVPCERRWSRLNSEEQLIAWEAGWGESPEGSGFFRPELLADEAIGVLAEYDDGRIVAGAVANRSATVIGLSNVFATTGDLKSAWLSAAAAATALWGRIPIVSYDSGPSLDAAHKAGFRSVGELVVWLKSPSLHSLGANAAL
jgi:hypothetical protein